MKIHKKANLAVSFMIFLLFALNAAATEDLPQNLNLDERPFSSAIDMPRGPFGTLSDMNLISGSEIFTRTQAVLDHFGVPQEIDYTSQLRSIPVQQSHDGLQKLLEIFDPHNQFHRFSAILDGNPSKLFVYRDIDAKQIPDFSVDLKDDTLTKTPPAIEANSRRKPTYFRKGAPLAGFRIALDPGHMGGKIWDERTGKFVHDLANGRELSEGVMALQVALLLKLRFEKLGARVLVTHKTLGPVEKNITYEGLHIADFAPFRLRSESLQNWFLNLLNAGPPGEALFEAFERSASTHKIYSESMRHDYFVLNADLAARVKLIEAFKPDATLIIHFDTSDPDDDPNGLQPIPHPGHHGIDATKVYVAGGFDRSEFATREERKNFAAHTLDVKHYSASLSLAKSVLTQLESKLGLQGDTGTTGSALLIEPGLQARNLSLTQKLTQGAVAYAECLYYNERSEFERLSQHTHTMQIGNDLTFYSDRLVTVTNALGQGVLEYLDKR